MKYGFVFVYSFCLKYILVFLVILGLYVDVLSVPMRFSDIFCIHEHILKYFYFVIFEVFELRDFLY